MKKNKIAPSPKLEKLISGFETFSKTEGDWLQELLDFIQSEFLQGYKDTFEGEEDILKDEKIRDNYKSWYEFGIEVAESYDYKLLEKANLKKEKEFWKEYRFRVREIKKLGGFPK